MVIGTDSRCKTLQPQQHGGFLVSIVIFLFLHGALSLAAFRWWCGTRERSLYRYSEPPSPPPDTRTLSTTCTLEVGSNKNRQTKRGFRRVHITHVLCTCTCTFGECFRRCSAEKYGTLTPFRTAATSEQYGESAVLVCQSQCFLEFCAEP